MSCSGRKIRPVKAGKNVSAATSPSFPAATASGIVPSAAQQSSKPGAEKSSAAIGNGRKHRRNRYPLEPKMSRKINASRTPHRGRTIYGASCLKFQELKETIPWRKIIDRLIAALAHINEMSAHRARNGELMMKTSNPTTIHWIIHISQRKETNAQPGKQKHAGKQRHGYPGLCD